MRIIINTFSLLSLVISLVACGSSYQNNSSTTYEPAPEITTMWENSCSVHASVVEESAAFTFSQCAMPTDVTCDVYVHNGITLFDCGDRLFFWDENLKRAEMYLGTIESVMVRGESETPELKISILSDSVAELVWTGSGTVQYCVVKPGETDVNLCSDRPVSLLSE